MARFKKHKQPKPYKTPFFIKMLDNFRGLFEKMGVNYSQLRLIVATKVTMDSRIDTNRPDPMNNKQKEGQNKYRSTMILGAIPGIFFAALMFLNINSFSKFGLIFSGMTMMMLLTFIQSFSGLFLDPTERDSLGVRGVDDQTLSVSRLVYLGYYILMLALPIILPSLIATVIKTNILAGLVFLLMAACDLIVCLLLTTLLYYLILSHFEAERLKSMISILQVLMLIVMIGIFYLPSVISVNTFNLFSNNFVWYYLILFPVWFASPVTMAADLMVNANFLILSGLGIVVTVILLLIYRRISPKFDQYLQRLKDESDDIKFSNRYLNFSQKVLTKNPTESAYYRLAYKILQIDRSLKMRIYPFFIVGYMIVVVSLFGIARGMITNGSGSNVSFNQFWAMTRSHHLLGFLSFAPIFAAIFSGLNIEQSSQAKSFGALNSTPTKSPALFFTASLKAFIAKLLIPVSLLTDIVVIFFVTPNQYPLLLLGNVTTVFTFVLIARIFIHQAPFTVIENPGKNSSNSVKGAIGSILLMYLSFGVAAIGYIFPWQSLVLSVIFIVLTIVLIYRGKINQNEFYYE